MERLLAKYHRWNTDAWKMTVVSIVVAGTGYLFGHVIVWVSFGLGAVFSFGMACASSVMLAALHDHLAVPAVAKEHSACEY